MRKYEREAIDHLADHIRMIAGHLREMHDGGPVNVFRIDDRVITVPVADELDLIVVGMEDLTRGKVATEGEST